MGENDNSRLTLLTQFLEQNPNDAFARYGLAMEHSRLGQTEVALEQFSKLLELHPDYTNGYFMAAQTLERVGRTAEAKKMLENGIAAAQRTGNKHALSEMSGMLEELDRE
jgi:tetratricopeptide (TPR) repeat protein